MTQNSNCMEASMRFTKTHNSYFFKIISDLTDSALN